MMLGGAREEIFVLRDADAIPLRVFLENKVEGGDVWLSVDTAMFRLAAHVPNTISEV